MRALRRRPWLPSIYEVQAALQGVDTLGDVPGQRGAYTDEDHPPHGEVAVLSRDVCKTCCRRYRRMLLGQQEESGWWNEDDEERWRTGIVQCPMNLARVPSDTLRWNITWDVPKWCKFAFEHSVMHQTNP